LLDVEVRIRAMPAFLRSECDRDTLPWWTQERLTLLASEGGCLAARRMYAADSDEVACFYLVVAPLIVATGSVKCQ
jgi:hypothetical protein